MSLQTLVRRTLAGLAIIAGSATLLGLSALTDGWQGVSLSPALRPWLLTSPLPALWTAAVVLWTLVLVAVMVSDDRAPRLAQDESVPEWTPLDEHVYADERSYIRLGRRQPEPILHVSGRRHSAQQQDFVA